MCRLIAKQHRTKDVHCNHFNAPQRDLVGRLLVRSFVHLFNALCTATHTHSYDRWISSGVENVSISKIHCPISGDGHVKGQREPLQSQVESKENQIEMEMFAHNEVDEQIDTKA